MPRALVWPPPINLNTPAWRTLENLIAEAPPSPDQNRLVVFGSAALQLTVANELLSADIDISLDLVTVGPRSITTPRAEEHLRRAAAKVNARLSKDLPYILVCHWMTFQLANRWEDARSKRWRAVGVSSILTLPIFCFPSFGAPNPKASKHFVLSLSGPVIRPRENLYNSVSRTTWTLNLGLRPLRATSLASSRPPICEAIRFVYGKRCRTAPSRSIARSGNPPFNAWKVIGAITILPLSVSWAVVRKHPKTKERMEGKGKIEAAPRIKIRRDSRDAFAPIKPLLNTYRRFPIKERASTKSS